MATSEDLFLRLYDDQLQLLIKAKPPSDFEPQAVAFSPDGSEIAVVYYNSNRLDIVDGDTLAARFTPDISQINNGTLSTVGWSADGETLYSGVRSISMGSAPSSPGRHADAARPRCSTGRSMRSRISLPFPAEE